MKLALWLLKTVIRVGFCIDFVGFWQLGQIPGMATPRPPPAWAAEPGCRQWQLQWQLR